MRDDQRHAGDAEQQADDLLPGDLFTQEDTYALEKIGVPSLVVSGWYDMGTTETVRIYDALRAAGDETNILFGPWDHGNGKSALGELYFSPFADARFSETPKLYLDFYDRHLKGDASKPAPGAKYFVMGSNEWKVASSWPGLGQGGC